MKKALSVVLALSFTVGTVAFAATPANAAKQCSGNAPDNQCKKNRN